MQLESNYVIYDRDKDFLYLRTSLSELPSQKWTSLFNRRTSSIYSSSLIGSKNVFIKISYEDFLNKNFLLIVSEKVTKTDEEISSDTLKKQIILRTFVNGLVIVHHDLSYIYNTFYKTNKNDYEQFVLNQLI